MKAFLDWHPTVLHDLHESVPYLYTSTGTGPYNTSLDPIVTDEWWLLAKHESQRDDQARRARRVDVGVLRRLGAQLPVLHRELAQRDRPLLRDADLRPVQPGT